MFAEGLIVILRSTQSVPERIAKKMTKEEIKSAVRRKRYNETIKAKEGKGRNQSM